MAADCKSARESVRWFESSPVHHRPSRQHPQKGVELLEKIGYYPLMPSTRDRSYLPTAGSKCGGVMWGSSEGYTRGVCSQGGLVASWHISSRTRAVPDSG